MALLQYFPCRESWYVPTSYFMKAIKQTTTMGKN